MSPRLRLSIRSAAVGANAFAAALVNVSESLSAMGRDLERVTVVVRDGGGD